MTGVWQLVRLALRRDRASLPVWLVVLGLMPAVAANAYDELYPTAAMQAPLTESIGRNPALSVLFGPAFDLSTAGGFTAWRMLSFLGVAIALMAIFTVSQNTRAEEDAGRQDLLAAGAVGRYAPLTAAVVVAAGTSAVIGLTAAAALAGIGQTAAGAIAFGAALAGVGWVFTGVSAITAQLVPYARTGTAIAGAVLGLSFLLRGIGDATAKDSWTSALSWLSPLGWSQQARPFAGERWWVLGLAVLAATTSVLLAFALLRRRDAGGGILPDRIGRATAAPGLRTPFALAWRLQRGSLLGWALGTATAGLAFGAIAVGVGDLVSDSPQLREILARLGGSQLLVDTFLAQIAGIFGMVTALYGVQATLRLRAEETAIRTEPVLATSVSRIRWAAGHLAFGIAGTAIVLAAAGLGTGVAHAARVGDAGYVTTMLGACLAQLPAIWVVVAVAVALFGILPHYTSVAWAIAGGLVIVALWGPILGLSQTAIDTSPFAHVPRIPGSDADLSPLLWLAAIAAVTVVVALGAFRRRDVG